MTVDRVYSRYSMAKWYEALAEDFQTISSKLPRDKVPLMDMARGPLSRSMYIRRLIEADIEAKEQAIERAESAA